MFLRFFGYRLLFPSWAYKEILKDVNSSSRRDKGYWPNTIQRKVEIKFDLFITIYSWECM